MSKPSPYRAQCTAKSKRSGERCKKDAVPGCKTCSMHGSGTKAARAAGAKQIQLRKTEDKARAAVVALGIKRTDDPITAMLDLIYWTAGEVDYWRSKVTALEDHALLWGKVKTEEGIEKGEVTDITTEQAGPPVEYVMLERASDRLAKYCADALRIGIEERRVRLVEAQGAALFQASRTILDRMLAVALEALGNDRVLRERVIGAWETALPIVVPEELRRLSSPQQLPAGA